MQSNPFVQDSQYYNLKDDKFLKTVVEALEKSGELRNHKELYQIQQSIQFLEVFQNDIQFEESDLSLFKQFEVQYYEDEEYVCQQSCTMNHFYIILQGQVEILINQGEFENDIKKLNSLQYFGHMENLYKTKAVFNYRACQEDTVLVKINQKVFLQLYGEYFQNQFNNFQQNFMDGAKLFANLNFNQQLQVVSLLQNIWAFKDDNIFENYELQNELFFIIQGEVKLSQFQQQQQKQSFHRQRKLSNFQEKHLKQGQALDLNDQLNLHKSQKQSRYQALVLSNVCKMHKYDQQSLQFVKQFNQGEVSTNSVNNNEEEQQIIQKGQEIQSDFPQFRATGFPLRKNVANVNRTRMSFLSVNSNNSNNKEEKRYSILSQNSNDDKKSHINQFKQRNSLLNVKSNSQEKKAAFPEIVVRKNTQIVNNKVQAKQTQQMYSTQSKLDSSFSSNNSLDNQQRGSLSTSRNRVKLQQQQINGNKNMLQVNNVNNNMGNSNNSNNSNGSYKSNFSNLSNKSSSSQKNIILIKKRNSASVSSLNRLKLQQQQQQKQN